MTATEVWGTTADPRLPQKRLAVTPSGRQVWVEITGDDRLRIIKQLPGRWPEVVMARERGESLEQIHRWARCALPPEEWCARNCAKPTKTHPDGTTEVLERFCAAEGEPCLRDLLATVWAKLETALQDLAAERARMMI